MRIFLKVRKVSNKLKMVNKIFCFSEESGTSAWEGIWHSGWEFGLFIGFKGTSNGNFPY